MTEQADQPHHNAPAHSTALLQDFFFAKLRVSPVCQPPYSPDLAPCDIWLFLKLKSPLKGRSFGNATVTQYTSCQWRLAADWLASRESDCSRMRSKVSSDWLPSYVKATRPVLEILKMAGYFPDSPRIYRRALVTFVIITAVYLNIQVFCDVTPPRLVNSHRRFGGF
jgi:hypothetical protein